MMMNYYFYSNDNRLFFDLNEILDVQLMANLKTIIVFFVFFDQRRKKRLRNKIFFKGEKADFITSDGLPGLSKDFRGTSKGLPTLPGLSKDFQRTSGTHEGLPGTSEELPRLPKDFGSHAFSSLDVRP